MSDDRPYSVSLRLAWYRCHPAVVRTASFPRCARPRRTCSVAPAPTDPVLLYKAWSDVLGQYPNYPAQQIGDCVSFGHGHGNDLLQCIESRLGEPIDYRETDTEFIYAASREVAGILGTGDGSYGAAAVKAMTTIGLVSREMLGTDGAYSGDRAKEWGQTGPPQMSSSRPAPYKLGFRRPGLDLGRAGGGDHQRISRDDLHETRDSPSRATQTASARPAVHGAIACSSPASASIARGPASSRVGGRTCPAGPTALGQPDFSFWAEQDVIEQILGEGDSWALSKAAAFMKRELPPAWKYDSAA